MEQIQGWASGPWPGVARHPPLRTPDRIFLLERGLCVLSPCWPGSRGECLCSVLDPRATPHGPCVRVVWLLIRPLPAV